MPDEIATPHPRFGATAGRSGWRAARCASVDAHGKHLFLRFEGELAIHSHLRMTGTWRVYARGQRWPRSPRARLAGPAPRRARGRAVRRPGARADDRRRARASTSASPASARHPRAGARRAALPAAAARGRPDPADRRRAARPAHDRRDRQPLEGRGLLRGRDRPLAAAPARSATRRRSRSSRATRPRMQQSARDGIQDALHRSSTARAGQPVPALRHGVDPRPRAGRRQPHDILVPRMSATEAAAHRPQGRRPIAPGNTPASLRRGARRTAST